jgi:hypothetical protein
MIADNALIGFAPCVICEAVFAFDAERVPSWAGKPICRPCLDKVNARKREMGLPEWTPLPGAYPFEDLDEDEVR